MNSIEDKISTIQSSLVTTMTNNDSEKTASVNMVLPSTESINTSMVYKEENEDNRFAAEEFLILKEKSSVEAPTENEETKDLISLSDSTAAAYNEERNEPLPSMVSVNFDIQGGSHASDIISTPLIHNSSFQHGRNSIIVQNYDSGSSVTSLGSSMNMKKYPMDDHSQQSSLPQMSYDVIRAPPGEFLYHRQELHEDNMGLENASRYYSSSHIQHDYGNMYGMEDGSVSIERIPNPRHWRSGNQCDKGKKLL